MRNRQHTLLAGVAALALFAASGIAFAQQNQQEQKGAAPDEYHDNREGSGKSRSRRARAWFGLCDVWLFSSVDADAERHCPAGDLQPRFGLGLVEVGR